MFKDDEPRLRGWFVLAAMISASFALASICCFWSARSPNPPMIIVMAVTIFYSNLVALWLALGSGWARLVFAVLFLFAVTICVAAAIGWRELVAFFFFYSGIVTVVGLTGFVLRWFFGELRIAASEGSDRDALQFGVRHLFILTTLVAFSVATLQAMFQSKLFNMDMGTALIITILVSMISLATVVQMWAFFGNRLTWLRGAVAALIAIVTSSGVALIRSDLSFWAAVIILNQAMTVSALLCIRFEGYRFVKRAQANFNS